MVEAYPLTKEVVVIRPKWLFTKNTGLRKVVDHVLGLMPAQSQKVKVVGYLMTRHWILPIPPSFFFMPYLVEFVLWSIFIELCSCSNSLAYGGQETSRWRIQVKDKLF